MRQNRIDSSSFCWNLGRCMPMVMRIPSTSIRWAVRELLNLCLTQFASTAGNKFCTTYHVKTICGQSVLAKVGFQL